MLVYHGSNVAVEKPEIRESNRNLDFGMGFYTTSNIEQAHGFCRIVCNRRGGMPVISVYNFDSEAAEKSLKFRIFPSADDEWFDFVCDHRMDSYKGDSYDIIIGPVANDIVYRTFVGYLAGVTSREDALKQLKVRELYSQITFCTEKALEFLKFSHYEEAKKS
jgi:hypothetical protein